MVADRIGMAARLLSSGVAMCVDACGLAMSCCKTHCDGCVKVAWCRGCMRLLLSFAAGHCKSYWSGCIKAAIVICQQILSILAIVIFLFNPVLELQFPTLLRVVLVQSLRIAM